MLPQIVSIEERGGQGRKGSAQRGTDRPRAVHPPPHTLPQ